MIRSYRSIGSRTCRLRPRSSGGGGGSSPATALAATATTPIIQQERHQQQQQLAEHRVRQAAAATRRSFAATATPGATAAATATDTAKSTSTPSSSSPSSSPSSSRLYAVGEGWTGALGTGCLDQEIPGHGDEEHDELLLIRAAVVEGGGNDDDDDVAPVLAFPPSSSSTTIRSVAVGWGHTALISEGDGSVDGNKSGSGGPRLYVTGRPHDFGSLLRLRRLPRWLRRSAAHRTLQSTQRPPTETATATATGIEGVEKKDADAAEGGYYGGGMGVMTSLVDRFVESMTDLVQLTDAQEHSHDWDLARRHSFLSEFAEIEIELPSSVSPSASSASSTSADDGGDDDENENEVPVSVACSAGLTAVVTESGRLYTFGLNGYGQCGIGTSSNNVWRPSPVVGLTAEYFASDGVPRTDVVEPSHPIVSVALGLQHGVCLNAAGEVFCFGKGDRGQLGQESILGLEESHSAVPVAKAISWIEEKGASSYKPHYERMGKATQIAAGMLHSAALTDDNRVLMWGKNVLPKSVGGGNDNGSNIHGDPAVDARLPVVLQGLPADLKVERIACGSHHTAVLLENGSVYAVGISSDTKEPIHEPVQLVPPGIVDVSTVRQFAAHMDRTTIVGDDGRLVLQVHLWKDPELQEYAVFTPAWIDALLEEDPALRVREVHRSWIHSVVLTD